VDTLESIKEYLQEKISCHVQLCVDNPVFEEVLLEFELKLYSGYDFAYYSSQLKDEIVQYLSPWAFGGETEIEFGGSIYKSQLINFIEERTYVDYITNVVMKSRTTDDDGNVVISADAGQIDAQTARSILVSAPAEDHQITRIESVTSESLQEDCT
jgi:hypothetical protein